MLHNDVWNLINMIDIDTTRRRRTDFINLIMYPLTQDKVYDLDTVFILATELEEKYYNFLENIDFTKKYDILEVMKDARNYYDSELQPIVNKIEKYKYEIY